MESCRADLHIIQPRQVQRVESYVMGIELGVAMLPPANAVMAEIPKQRQWFSAEALLNVADLVQPDILYGVYTNYSHHRRQCAVIWAVEVSSIDNPPENMVGVAISAGSYLVFEATENSTNAIIQAWHQVELYFMASITHQRAFTTDFERHTPHQVELYIAIKPL